MRVASGHSVAVLRGLKSTVRQLSPTYPSCLLLSRRQVSSTALLSTVRHAPFNAQQEGSEGRDATDSAGMALRSAEEGSSGLPGAADVNALPSITFPVLCFPSFHQSEQQSAFLSRDYERRELVAVAGGAPEGASEPANPRVAPTSASSVQPSAEELWQQYEAAWDAWRRLATPVQPHPQAHQAGTPPLQVNRAEEWSAYQMLSRRVGYAAMLVVMILSTCGLVYHSLLHPSSPHWISKEDYKKAIDAAARQASAAATPLVLSTRPSSSSAIPVHFAEDDESDDNPEGDDTKKE